MGKRKVTILEAVAVAVAEASWFIESKGLPDSAKKFVDEAFAFFETYPTRKYCIILAVIKNGNQRAIVA